MLPPLPVQRNGKTNQIVFTEQQYLYIHYCRVNNVKFSEIAKTLSVSHTALRARYIRRRNDQSLPPLQLPEEAEVVVSDAMLTPIGRRSEFHIMPAFHPISMSALRDAYHMNMDEH